MKNAVNILLLSQSQQNYIETKVILAEAVYQSYHISWMGGLSINEEVLEASRFDLVLIHDHWPEKDIFSVIHRIAQLNKNLPCIIISNKQNSELDQQVIAAGAADYIIKNEISAAEFERRLRFSIERKREEARLAELAHYDSLTRIPNRLLFRDRLEHTLEQSERDGMPFALMYLDLDGFKKINDEYGHEVGDAMIRMCSDRLVKCMRRSDSVARVGGDEFTILLGNITSIADVALIAEKIIAELIKPSSIVDNQIQLGCSIGIALYPESGKDADSLMRHADQAMYRAKKKPQSGYCFYSDDNNRTARQRLTLLSSLRRGLEENEFSINYQPRMELKTGRAVGLEALVRWIHPEKGELLPEVFIPAAEEAGLIIPIGYWVLERVCCDIKTMQLQGVDPLPIAINLSMRQFMDGQLVDRISSIIKKHKISGTMLEFELTENAVVGNLECVALCMQALQHLKVSFSLDDFGTAYSSLEYLQRLPVKKINIDRRFINEINSRQSDAHLVQAMINIGHNLNKIVMAEGVETKEQLEYLKLKNCDQIQGNVFQKPQSIEQICSLLKHEVA